MDQYSLIDWLQIAGLVGAAAGYFAGAFKWGWSWVWRLTGCALSRVRMVWDALERLHPMLFGEDGIPARLDTLTLQGQERGLELSALGKKVDSIANAQRAMLNTNPRLGAFEADEHGLWTVVNRPFLKWTGLTAAEAARWGWLNAVHPDDQARVRAAWESCVKDVRRFECRFRMVQAVTGKVFEVDAAADPIPEGLVPCERWVGSIHEVQVAAAA